jgi:hypothetical protein
MPLFKYNGGREMIRGLTIAIAAVLFLMTSGSVQAGRMVTEEKSVEYTDEKSVSIEIDFGVGVLFIDAGDPNKIVDAVGHFDSRIFEYEFDYRKKKNSGDLYFDVSTRRHKWNNIEGDDNEWRFGLTNKVPIDLLINAGACESNLQLGGLSISHLDLDIGASDCEVSFDDPNQCKLERLIVDAGASSLYMDRLGNANFEELDFDGGVGSYEIDFSGDFKFDAEAYISVGLGSIDIFIPEHVGVRLLADGGLFSSIDFPRRAFREIDDDYYESENWDDAVGHIEIEVDVGMGSIDIRYGH